MLLASLVRIAVHVGVDRIGKPLGYAGSFPGSGANFDEYIISRASISSNRLRWEKEGHCSKRLEK
jgi:hypothetical protein